VQVVIHGTCKECNTWLVNLLDSVTNFF
jgi:hypothetical protein